MNFEDINFPLYRCYKNKKSYFKIVNPRLFEEIQILGSKKIIRETTASQFPELNFIRDMVYNYNEMADQISEAEYERQRE